MMVQNIQFIAEDTDTRKKTHGLKQLSKEHSLLPALLDVFLALSLAVDPSHEPDRSTSILLHFMAFPLQKLLRTIAPANSIYILQSSITLDGYHKLQEMLPTMQNHSANRL